MPGRRGEEKERSTSLFPSFPYPAVRGPERDLGRSSVPRKKKGKKREVEREGGAGEPAERDHPGEGKGKKRRGRRSFLTCPKGGGNGKILVHPVGEKNGGRFPRPRGRGGGKRTPHEHGFALLIRREGGGTARPKGVIRCSLIFFIGREGPSLLFFVERSEDGLWEGSHYLEKEATGATFLFIFGKKKGNSRRGPWKTLPHLLFSGLEERGKARSLFQGGKKKKTRLTLGCDGFNSLT